MTKDIKLIITDLDNTLLRSDKSISQFTIDIVEKCKQRGILFGVATARSRWSAERYLDIIKPDVVITSGGAVAKYNGEILYERTLSAEASNNLIRECLLSEDIGDITVQTPNGYYHNRKEHHNRKAIFSDFVEPLNLPTYKIIVKVFNEETAQDLLNKFTECSYISYRGEAWSRFAHKNASKVEAIKGVSNHFGFQKEQIITFGDDSNDIGMIRYFNGIAVSNAIQEVKDVASFITKSNDEDGVAHYIKENILS